MPTKEAIPADIEEIIAALHAATRHAEDLVASAPASALEHPPAPGRWSAAQCLYHLALTNFAYTAAMRPACLSGIHPRRGPLHVGFPTRWFLSLLEPPVGKRVRAPRAITPAPAIDASGALREFQRSQAAVIELLMECRQLDLNRIRFPNPFVPGIRFTVGGGFLIIAAHERRHLWQASVAISSQRTLPV